MAVAFDSLGYSRHLRDKGVAPEHAEAMADAARTYIMQELATRADLGVLRTELAATKTDLERAIEMMALRITIRMGVMLAGAVAILGTLVTLF